MRAQCYTPELTSAFAADPWGLGWHFQPPGGESQHDVEQRMTAYILGEVLPRVTPDAPGVVVGHGMAIKVRSGVWRWEVGVRRCCSCKWLAGGLAGGLAKGCCVCPLKNPAFSSAVPLCCCCRP